MITRFERYMLKRIAKRISTQGPWHESNVTEYYKIMAEAATKEFTEDNKPTLEGFLRSCFRKGLK